MLTTRPGELAASPALLARARLLFVRFVLLGAGVQVIELLDAESAWWPDRAAVLVGIAVVIGWAVRLGRSPAATWLGDALIVTAVTVIGLGLDRNGAVLVSLVAVLPLRALYGRRHDVTLVAIGMFVGYGVITTVHHGADRVLDPGFLVVVAGVSAFTATLRGVGELLGSHDLSARLDEVATATAARLVAATSTADVDELERQAREQVRVLGDEPAGRGPQEAIASVSRRLAADARLARQRIASEARYRTIAEGTRDGVYLRAIGSPGAFADRGYSYLNPAAEDLLGVGRADLAADLGLARRLLHEDDVDQLDAAIVAEGFVAEPIEVRLRRPDGQTRWVRISERVVDVDGEERTALGTLHDVTRQHAEAAALQRVAERERAAADELRHLDAMKSTFLQAVSHELRTPLSAVIGAAQTLGARDAVLDAAQRRRMLEVVQRQSSRLERLLTDLLDVDRLSRGLVTPDRRPTDLRQLAAGVVAALDPREAARIEVAGDRGRVPVDAPQVERIIDNLLRNAVRHTPADGAIVCTIVEDDDAVHLVVEDEGPGVPEELRRELFEPFAQGPSAQVAASPGTGIGLALVRALAELHDGRAWMEERDEGGARFVVEFPFPATVPSTERDADAASAAPPPSPPAPLSTGAPHG